MNDSVAYGQIGVAWQIDPHWRVTADSTHYGTARARWAADYSSGIPLIPPPNVVEYHLRSVACALGYSWRLGERFELLPQAGMLLSSIRWCRGDPRVERSSGPRCRATRRGRGRVLAKR